MLECPHRRKILPGRVAARYEFCMDVVAAGVFMLIIFVGMLLKAFPVLGPCLYRPTGTGSAYDPFNDCQVPCCLTCFVLSLKTRSA